MCKFKLMIDVHCTAYKRCHIRSEIFHPSITRHQRRIITQQGRIIRSSINRISIVHIHRIAGMNAVQENCNRMHCNKSTRSQVGITRIYSTYHTIDKKGLLITNCLQIYISTPTKIRLNCQQSLCTRSNTIFIGNCIIEYLYICLQKG